MKLVSFSVSNFRSITKAYKLPIRQSTILIGPNNEGKSNILKALTVSLGVLETLGGVQLHRGRLQLDKSYSRRGGISDYNWKKDFPISLQKDNPNGESIFKLDFELTEDEVEEFKKEVNSNLDGTLPIQLALGQNESKFKIVKKGPGASALTKKAEAIAQFIGKRLIFTPIPAVRTSENAQNIVDSIVERELSMVEENPEFKKALEEVAKIQDPILSRISQNIKDTLKEFLPKVRDVKVVISQNKRYRALRRGIYEIIVDDGTPTALENKGDGVQSLAALSLMKETSRTYSKGKQLILAIEEPESHLHPNAVHQLRGVISKIAEQNQIIMTTHCPIFVDRVQIKSNILVQENEAKPAKSVKEIREILGVRAADNLQHAELILLVEGGDDKCALESLLKRFSQKLNTALSHHTLVIDFLTGGTNLSYKLSLIRESMCQAHCFLDHDDCGRKAAEQAEYQALLCLKDVNFSTCNGMKDSEIEDMYNENIYSNMLQAGYGVSLSSSKFKGNKKWSDRLKETFLHQGKTWSNKIEQEVKSKIADLVATDPSNALNQHKSSSFDALVKALEDKIDTLAINKE